METNATEFESWYSFIRHDGNEDELKHLQKQIKQVDMEITDDDLSTFDLDLNYLVSAQTAKEMTKVDLNPYSYHRKFDGRLKHIDFNFKKKDTNDKKIARVFDLLGYCQIEDFISDEDIDTDDLSHSSSEDELLSDDSEDERPQIGVLPKALQQDLPRFAKKAQKRR